MDIVLLRHAVAVDRGTPGYAHDGDRPLTPEGERAMREIARGMHALGLSFDRMLSSPYLRARRTAEIAAGALDGQVEYTEHLTPGGDPRSLIRELQKSPPASRILLVGHEPHLGRLVSLLLCGDDRLPFALKKGGLCRLSAEGLSAGACASLHWLLTPKQLRMLA